MVLARSAEKKSYTGLETLEHGQLEESTYLLDTNRKSNARNCFERTVIVAFLIGAIALLVLFVKVIPRDRNSPEARSNVVQPQCALNPVCAAQGLDGWCCPTSSGDYLGCCPSSPASCASNKACAKLGIEGNCCPTDMGEYLQCCFAGSISVPTVYLSHPIFQPRNAGAV